MFHSRRSHYAGDIQQGAALNVKPAILAAPNGQEQGAAIFIGKYVRLVLREDHAIALCNAIVDALDEHRKPEHHNAAEAA